MKKSSVKSFFRKSPRQRKSQKSEIIFETVDSRNKIVKLQLEQYQHITTEHPYFKEKSDLIKAVVEDPIMIITDKTFDTTINYFDWNVTKGIFSRKWVQIPVDVSSSVGYVKTAILRADIPTGTKIIWLNPKKKITT